MPKQAKNGLFELIYLIKVVEIGDACKKAGLDHHVGNKDTLMYTIGQKAVYSKVGEAIYLSLQCYLGY